MSITRPSRPPCHGESERMKAARLVVLTVAVAAGGVAAMLAGRSEKKPEVKNKTELQIASDDVLVAIAGMAGHCVNWKFHPQVRSAKRHRIAFLLYRALLICQRRTDRRGQTRK